VNPLYRYADDIAGYKIIINDTLTKNEQYSRSPSRAKRRLKRGFLPHMKEVPSREIIIDKVNHYMICHSVVIAELKNHIQNAQTEIEQDLYGVGKVTKADTSAGSTLTLAGFNAMLDEIKQSVKPNNYQSFLKWQLFKLGPF
jgi:hypothetical protein